MKLSRIPKTEPQARLNLSIKQSVVTQLEQYQRYYEKTFGESVAQARLVEEILRVHFVADRDFAKFVANQSEQG